MQPETFLPAPWSQLDVLQNRAGKNTIAYIKGEIQQQEIFLSTSLHSAYQKKKEKGKGKKEPVSKTDNGVLQHRLMQKRQEDIRKRNSICATLFSWHPGEYLI